MISSFVRALVSAFKARRELALENVDLRQQLAVLPRSVKGPRVLGCPFHKLRSAPRLANQA